MGKKEKGIKITPKLWVYIRVRMIADSDRDGKRWSNCGREGKKIQFWPCKTYVGGKPFKRRCQRDKLRLVGMERCL